DITLAAAAGAPGDAYLHFCREVHFLVHPLYLEAESERVLHPVFTGLGARACLDIVDTGGSRLPDRHPKVLPDRRDLLFFHPDEHHSLARGHLDHWDLEFPGNIRDPLEFIWRHHSGRCAGDYCIGSSISLFDCTWYIFFHA